MKKTPRPHGGPAFEETQRSIGNPFVWVGGLFCAAVLAPQYLGTPPTLSGPAGTWTLIITGGLILLVAVLRLNTVVGDSAVQVRLWPFPGKTVRYRDIRTVEAVAYRPIVQYRGWGLRRGFDGSRAMTLHGNRGVRVEVSSGRTLLIGSQRAEELAAALRVRVDG